MRQSGWLGFGRRLLLKARFRAQRVNARIRDRFGHGDPSVSLEHVQRRLELLLTAVHGRPIPIVPTDDTLWTRERVRNLASRDPRARELASSVDGEVIYLPPHLAAGHSADEAVARYRLLALEQAERVARGTVGYAPIDDRLERDLYLLREAEAIDAHIARAHPGVARALRDERNFALARRPKLRALTPAERDVELRLRDALAAQPGEVESSSVDAAASLAWALETARGIRAQDGDANYRGLPLASIWGTLKAAEPNARGKPREQQKRGARSGDTGQLLREAQGEGASSGVDPTSPTDDEPEHDEGGDGGEHESPLARALPEQSRARTGTVTGADPLDPQAMAELDGLPPAIAYDEWNAHTASYVKRAAAVRLYESAESDGEWSRAMLGAHAATVRQVRHQFERLRARRSLLARQPSGDDLDLAACVHAIVDRRIGRPADDRLYVDARPARRGLAIALLVDVSGSTEARVTSDLRIIDLERIALLLAGEALDALGDLYAVYAFAGKNAFNVKVTPVKEFGERSGDTMFRRIAALQPGGFTRLGAAVRHATHRLARQSAGHRLLLILSDGRPNDVDRYQGEYGVEDARQAIMEARASGVYPFCLTVDRDASEYLPRIFGAAGHTILQRAEQLPASLLRVVQALIRRG